jgi:hypothetical protein
MIEQKWAKMALYKSQRKGWFFSKERAKIAQKMTKNDKKVLYKDVSNAAREL